MERHYWLSFSVPRETWYIDLLRCVLCMCIGLVKRLVNFVWLKLEMGFIFPKCWKLVIYSNMCHYHLFYHTYDKYHIYVISVYISTYIFIIYRLIYLPSSVYREECPKLSSWYHLITDPGIYSWINNI